MSIKKKNMSIRFTLADKKLIEKVAKNERMYPGSWVRLQALKSLTEMGERRGKGAIKEYRKGE